MSWLPPDVDGEWEEYDESDAKVRPNPKGNKPRSKTRPEGLINGTSAQRRLASAAISWSSVETMMRSTKELERADSMA